MDFRGYHMEKVVAGLKVKLDNHLPSIVLAYLFAIRVFQTALSRIFKVSWNILLCQFFIRPFDIVRWPYQDLYFLSRLVMFISF